MTTPTHPISEKKLDVAALLEGTTPGPWEMGSRLGEAALVASSGVAVAYAAWGGGSFCSLAISTHDARLIAAAPRLAAEHIALTKKVDELEAALRPFAEAAEELDSFHHDNSPIWETSAAMSISGGELRRARTALNDTTQCRESDNG